jgi:hypothetical protein
MMSAFGTLQAPATMGALPNCLSVHHCLQFTSSCASCPGLVSANKLLTEENAASTEAENLRPPSLIVCAQLSRVVVADAWPSRAGASFTGAPLLTSRLQSRWRRP